MEENEKTTPEKPAVDVDTIVKDAVKRVTDSMLDVTKAMQQKIEEMPVNQPPPVIVTKDAAEVALEGHPYKSFGEFLMDVKQAGLGGLPADHRLQVLRSRDADVEGGFDMTKALGDKFVGSLYKSAIKAPTGLGEATPSAGGFLVGTDRQAGIMARVYETGSLLQRLALFRVSAGSNAMTFYGENETSRANGSRRGGVRAYWTAEAGEKTASQPEFREIELKLRKVVGLVYATDELLADAAALESYIMRVFPEELRFVVEDAIINGTGAGQPLGIMSSGALVSVAKEVGQAAATLVSENLVKMWARMWAPSRRNAVWLINQDVEPQLHLLNLPVGVGGQLTYMPPGGLSAVPYGTIFGRPVMPVEYCQTLGTTGDVILADLSEYYAIEKGGIEAASSIHVRFVYDETVFRFVYRFDGQPAWAAPLTPFKGSNTLSPFVALATRS